MVLLADPINLNPLGQHTVVDVWTATLTDGTGLSSWNDNCGDWTNPIYNGWTGYSDDNSQIWTDWGPDDCSSSKHLYCFQQ